MKKVVIGIILFIVVVVIYSYRTWSNPVVNKENREANYFRGNQEPQNTGFIQEGITEESRSREVFENRNKSQDSQNTQNFEKADGLENEVIEEEKSANVFGKKE